MNNECVVNDLDLIIGSPHMIQKVRLSEIVYFVIKNSYTYITYIGKKELIISTSLSRLTEILPSCFYRINKSVIINMHYCDKCELSYSNSSVQMNDSAQFSVSRRNHTLFRTMYQEFLIQKQPFTDYNEPFTDI